MNITDRDIKDAGEIYNNYGHNKNNAAELVATIRAIAREEALEEAVHKFVEWWCDASEPGTNSPQILRVFSSVVMDGKEPDQTNP